MTITNTMNTQKEVLKMPERTALSTAVNEAIDWYKKQIDPILKNLKIESAFIESAKYKNPFEQIRMLWISSQERVWWLIPHKEAANDSTTFWAPHLSKVTLW